LHAYKHERHNKGEYANATQVRTPADDWATSNRQFATPDQQNNKAQLTPRLARDSAASWRLRLK